MEDSEDSWGKISILKWTAGVRGKDKLNEKETQSPESECRKGKR